MASDGVSPKRLKRAAQHGSRAVQSAYRPVLFRQSVRKRQSELGVLILKIPMLEALSLATGLPPVPNNSTDRPAAGTRAEPKRRRDRNCGLQNHPQLPPDFRRDPGPELEPKHWQPDRSVGHAAPTPCEVKNAATCSNSMQH